MSLGEERVRKNFNPSARAAVDEIKQGIANLIDVCEIAKGRDSEKNRALALAQTHLEEACMWLVKAMTLQDYREVQGLVEYPADHPAPGDLGSVPL